MRRTLVLLSSHTLAAGIGFAAGIYLLPILAAPPAPGAADVASAASGGT